MSRAMMRGEIRHVYLDLVNKFPLTSIRDDRHLCNAQKMLDSLIARGPLKEGEDDYLEALSDLIGVYEAQNVHFDVPGDAEVLTYLMELKGASQAKVAADTRIAKSTISEVMSGRRNLTRQHIARLAEYFGVSQASFSVPIAQ